MSTAWILLIIVASVSFLLASYRLNAYLKLTKLGLICHSSFRAVLNKSSLPLVEFTIGSASYYFVVDTGATTNLLDDRFHSLLSRDNIVSTETIKHRVVGLGHTGDEQSKDSTKVTLSLKDKGIKYGDVSFMVADLFAPFEVLNASVDKPVIGILGAGFLKQYGWIIDFKNLIIWKNL